MVYELEQGLTRGSKVCLTMVKVDVEELMRLPGVDVNGPFSHRIEQLVESARECVQDMHLLCFITGSRKNIQV